MELLDIVLGLFPAATPDDRAPLGMDFHHVPLGALPRPSEDPAEYHRDIAHEIHRIVVHHNKPREIEILRQLGLGGIEKPRLVHPLHG